MSSGPVVAMVWQGLDAVKTGRAMLGATNPLQSVPGKCHLIISQICLVECDVSSGSIRGDFGLSVGRNICHGSDSIESAEREIKL